MNVNRVGEREQSAKAKMAAFSSPSSFEGVCALMRLFLDGGVNACGDQTKCLAIKPNYFGS